MKIPPPPRPRKPRREPLRLHIERAKLHTLLLRFSDATLLAKPPAHLARLESALLRAAARVSRLESALLRAEERERAA